MNAVGKILKNQLKTVRGLEYKFVSKVTGIPYGSLRQYLNDCIPMPEPKIRLICLTFDIPPQLVGLDLPAEQQFLPFSSVEKVKSTSVRRKNA